MLMNCGLSTVVWRWSTVSIKVIRIWSLHHPPLQREQLLWCAGMNTSKCMWLLLFPIIVYFEISLKLILKVFHIESLWAAHQRVNLKSNAFGFWLSHWKLFERFISNSYSCQADIKLWNFRNVWFSPEPSSNQTELSTTCVQSNTCWLLRIPLQSGHVHLWSLLYCDWFFI